MALDEGKILRTILTELAREGHLYAPAGVSVRHLHLSREDLDQLFGTGYALHPKRDLVQPGQYAAEETVTIEGPKGRLEHVRIIGPLRKESQVELSRTDAMAIGIKDLPVRMSGDLANTPGIRITGPNGSLQIRKGTIIAARHLHMSEEQARVYKLHDGQVISVRIGGQRPAVLEQVICRCGKGHELEFHVDTDEANACLIQNGDYVEILPSGCGSPEKTEDTFDPDRISRKALNILAGKERNFEVYSCMDAEPKDHIGQQEILDLVTEQDINEAVRNGKGAVYCSQKALITPAAADRSSSCHIEIIRAEDARRQQPGVPLADAEILELVTAGDLNVAFKEDRKVLYCTQKALITPAAKERIAETGIRIVRI